MEALQYRCSDPFLLKEFDSGKKPKLLLICTEIMFSVLNRVVLE